jgi:hypothetical protein
VIDQHGKILLASVASLVVILPHFPLVFHSVTLLTLAPMLSSRLRGCISHRKLVLGCTFLLVSLNYFLSVGFAIIVAWLFATGALLDGITSSLLDCRLTQFPAETGLNASVAKQGEFMCQRLKQVPSLFRGFFVWKPDGYPLHNLSYFVGDHCTGKSSDRWQKEPFDLLHRRFDAYHRLNLAICCSARV